MFPARLILLLALAWPAPCRLSSQDRAFVEDLGKRELAFFREQADPHTGLVRDRARTTGVVESEHNRDAASIAATGFGLTALSIGAQHGWVRRDAALQQVATTLHFFAERAPTEHGWFYHFMDAGSGARKWKSELSSIDTALLLAGILTARQCFAEDATIARLADAIYARVDFR